MARGKKLFLQIAALAMSATMAIGFAACSGGEQKEHQHADVDGDGYCDTDGTWIGEGEDPALHEHTYDTTKWAYDDTYHYHAGNCGHDVLKDRERHSFTGDEAKCTVCDYKRGFNDIYQMYLGGAIRSLEEEGYKLQQAFSINNWSEYAARGYKLDYDEATQSWRTKDSIQLGLGDQVVVINVISHMQYGLKNGSSQYGVMVDTAGDYFISLKEGETIPVLTKDYGNHTHTYDTWGYDADNHWKQCADDGEKDPATIAPHKFDETDGHCTDNCGAVSQEKCKHEDGYQYNYTKTTLPAPAVAAGQGLKKYCPNCGKAESVNIASGVGSSVQNPVTLTPAEGYIYGQNFINGIFVFSEPGTYTLQVIEPVWDDGNKLVLTALTVCDTGSKQGRFWGDWQPETSVGCSSKYGPARTDASVYDFTKEGAEWAQGESRSKWQNKIKINGRSAKEALTDKWTEFKSITVTVTQEDIEAVPDQVIKATQEGKADTPVPKRLYVAFCAVALKEQKIGSGATLGAWLYEVTEGAAETCKHEHLSYTKKDADEANKVKAGETGTINATCTDCNEQVSVPFTKPTTAPSPMDLAVAAVPVYDIGTKYFISVSGRVAFKIDSAGTYTLTRSAVYNVPNVEDKPSTPDKDETETYCYFFRDVYINSTKASKDAADAIYKEGSWQTSDFAMKWISKIKFDGNAAGTGYEKKQDTFTFTITVSEEDLEGGSLYVTLGLYYGAKENAQWTANKAGHYEFVEMNKETDAVSTVMATKEYFIPGTKKD